MIVVDSNVLLDIVRSDPVWSAWSISQLDAAVAQTDLTIDPVVYAEITPAFADVGELDTFIARSGATLRMPSRQALFLAGRAHQRYRDRGGRRDRVLPDFLIGAHAAAASGAILTRDPRRYRSYFPEVRLITP